MPHVFPPFVCAVKAMICPAGSLIPPMEGQNGVYRWAKGGLLSQIMTKPG